MITSKIKSSSLMREVIHQQRLCRKRHPLFAAEKSGKLMRLVSLSIIVIYLILLGVVAAMNDDKIEAYDATNKWLFALFALDFVISYTYKNRIMVNVKPYLLLPIKKKWVVKAMLLVSGLDIISLIWFLFFIPFALIAIMPIYGIIGVIGYWIGLYLMLLINNYLYQLFQSLSSISDYFNFLPLIFYGAGIGIMFISVVGNNWQWSWMKLGKSLMEWSPYTFIALLVVLYLVFLLTLQVVNHVLYQDINRVSDTKIKSVSELNFLNRFGRWGEVFKLQIRQITRNKNPRNMAFLLLGFVILCLFLLNMKSESGINSFFYWYAPFLLSTIFLAYEANYMEFLMMHEGVLYSIIKLKYWFVMFGGFLSCIPLLVMAIYKPELMMLWITYTVSIMGIFTPLLLFVLINRQAAQPMNERMNKMSNNRWTMLLPSLAVVLPISVILPLSSLFEWIGYICIFIGSISLMASNLWIKRIYKKFIKNKYQNLDVFRASRTR